MNVTSSFAAQSKASHIHELPLPHHSMFSKGMKTRAL